MNKLIFNITKFLICILFLFDGCAASPKIKIMPEYHGVDPRAQGYVDEYMYLSRQKHIEFDDTVTIGFKNLNEGNIIGLCTYGGPWREIDIDINYWNNSSKMTHMALLFHELTHCYCGRDHDYGPKSKYPETEAARIARALQWKAEGGPRPGYWDDGCPVSLMYPVIVDDDCTRAHYNEYIEEMFSRCDPW